MSSSTGADRPGMKIFSIIVPTYNRPRQLAACLQSLALLDFPRDQFEIVVVDDGGETPVSLPESAHDGGLAIKIIRQINAGPAKARNTGAANAAGRFLAFTDDDCEPARDWLRELARAFDASPEAAVGGRTVNALTANLHACASQLLIDYLYAYYNSGEGGPRFFASNNLAMPAESFRALGGFDTQFPLAAGEDRDLCDRWLGQGHRLVYVPEATVYHRHALTFRRFCRQHFAYGRGAYRFHLLRSQRHTQPLRVEPLRFYFNMLLFPFGRFSGLRCWAMGTLLGISQALNAGGFFWERHLSSKPR